MVLDSFGKIRTTAQSKNETDPAGTGKGCGRGGGKSLAEEVIRNNRSHKPTRWILPGGPAQQYDVFTERVNRESISLKNLHIFHMDTWLDWQYRLFPPENTRFSCKAKMEKIFYGKINPSLNVPEAQRYFPDPLEPDRFDEAIEELGGIDTLVGGVGCKGLWRLTNVRLPLTTGSAWRNTHSPNPGLSPCGKTQLLRMRRENSEPALTPCRRTRLPLE